MLREIIITILFYRKDILDRFGRVYNRYHSPIWNLLLYKETFQALSIQPKIMELWKQGQIARKFPENPRVVEFRYANNWTKKSGNFGREIKRKGNSQVRNFRKFVYSSPTCPLFQKISGNVNALPFASGNSRKFRNISTNGKRLSYLVCK